MLKTSKPSHKEEQGFTIIELMIAAMVFAMVLLLLTYGFIQISRIFYKGVTTSRTQEAARLVIDDIARSIQFSGGAVTTIQGTDPGIRYFCIDSSRYTFVKNTQLVESPANHVLIKDTVGSCTAAADLANPPNGAVELVPLRLRVSDIQINPVAGSNNVYEVVVILASGDDDMLDLTNLLDPVCSNNLAGGQFCAVSPLRTFVQKRI